jgi:hypothetical protein
MAEGRWTDKSGDQPAPNPRHFLCITWTPTTPCPISQMGFARP